MSNTKVMQQLKGNVSTNGVKSLTGNVYAKGIDGKNAYDYAVAGGFKGTEEEFMEMLLNDGTVKTVNGIEPDENGNIEIESVKSFNDLEDKPFYSEIEENVVLPKSTVVSEMYLEDFQGYLVQQNIELIKGETYIVVYNGVEYECECKNREFIPGVRVNLLGNNVMFTGMDTGHPFLIADATPLFGTGVGFMPIPTYNPNMTDSTTWEISVVKRREKIIKTIDSKFIKDMYYESETETEEVNLVKHLTSEEYNNGKVPLEDYYDDANAISCNFVPGISYKVIYNNIVYDDLVCYIDEYGNRVIASIDDCPFSIHSFGERNILYINNNFGQGSYLTPFDISIIEYRKKIHRIDPKYIPDTIARVPDNEEILKMLVEADIVNIITDANGDIVTDLNGDIAVF